MIGFENHPKGLFSRGSGKHDFGEPAIVLHCIENTPRIGDEFEIGSVVRGEVVEQGGVDPLEGGLFASFSQAWAGIATSIRIA